MKQRKIILYIAMSLDGYIARPEGSIDWLDTGESVEEDASYEAFYQEVDTVILGRTTYDQVTNELSPDVYPYADVTSFVMTTNVQEQTSEKPVHFVNQNVVDLVNTLKAMEGKAIWVVGGVSVITPLVNENLIDEYRIAVVPILLGKGIRLFGEFQGDIALQQTKAYTKNQLTYLVFKKRKDD